MLKITISIALFFMALGTASAETVTLSLKEVITRATGANNLVKAAGYRADAARQRIAIAESGYYPGIAFEESFTASNAPTQAFMMKLDEGRFSQNDFQIANLNSPGTNHDFRTAVTLYQPIYNPSTAPAREMAVKESEKQGYSFDSAKQDTAFTAFRLFLELQKAKAQARAAEQAVAEAQENLRLARVRSDNGTGLRSDELRARTHLALAEQRVITEHNRLTLASLQLASVLAMNEGEPVPAEDAIGTVQIHQTPDELITAALANRSDLNQARSELERTEAGIRLARGGYLPTVGAFASYQLNAQDTPFGADNDSWSAGVSLKWQIFDGFKRCRERDRAMAEHSAATELLESRRRTVRLGVRESLLRRDETGKRLEVARHSVADAEETVRLLSKRFENSLSTMIELLDAQTVLNQSRANLIEAEADYALTGGQVLHMAGIFLKEMQQ